MNLDVHWQTLRASGFTSSFIGLLVIVQQCKYIFKRYLFYIFLWHSFKTSRASSACVVKSKNSHKLKCTTVNLCNGIHVCKATNSF